MLETEGLGAFLGELAELASRFLPGVSWGLTVQTDGRPWTATSSGPLASQLDDVQYAADTGPCLDAMRTGAVNSLRDLADAAATRQWSDYRARAVELGIGSSLSLPLSVRDSVVGALNLYAPRPGGFDDNETSAAAAAFAGQAAAGVGMVLRFADQAKVTEQLRTALESRATIDQAIGAVMAHQGCTAAEAFEVLVDMSQRLNTKLRTVAQQLLDSLASPE